MSRLDAEDEVEHPRLGFVIEDGFLEGLLVLSLTSSSSSLYLSSASIYIKV